MDGRPAERGGTAGFLTAKRGLLTDVSIAAVFVLCAVAVLVSGHASVVLLAAFTVAFVAHVAGLLPWLAYEGPSTVVLLSFFLAIGFVIVAL